jgi:hypothetical protein
VKEVDDIMGGAAAWQNVDQTTGISLLLSLYNILLSSFPLGFVVAILLFPLLFSLMPLPGFILPGCRWPKPRLACLGLCSNVGY